MKISRFKVTTILVLISFQINVHSGQSANAAIPGAFTIPSIPRAYTPNPEPSPMPGPAPTPPYSNEKITLFLPIDFAKPIVTTLQVSIANRATGTPGLLEGPRLAVANIGGYSQIIPTISTLVKNNVPTIALVLRGLLQFGASN